MIVLQAPHELIQTTTLLPSPKLDDTRMIKSSSTLKRAMDNTSYTYVKTNTRYRLSWQFELDRGKAIELQEFFLAYCKFNVRVTDWRGEVWVVNFTEETLTITPFLNGELCTCTVELEGYKL